MPNQKVNSTARVLLPAAIASEDAIIGTCLDDNDKLFEILTIVEAEDFYAPYKQAIVREMVEAVERNESFDAVSISTKLYGVDEFNKAGGRAFLDALPRVKELKTHAELVRTKSIKRQKMETHQQILSLSLTERPGNEQKIAELEAKLFEIDSATRRQTDYDSVGAETDDIIQEAFQRSLIKSPYTGLITGFGEFDDMTGGPQDGDLILVAARPSMGKSALVVNICENVYILAPEKVAVVFSLEMKRKALVNRMICSQAFIPFEKIRSGTMTIQEWARYIAVTRRLKKSNIIINEQPGISPLQMKMKLRRILAEKKRIDLIVVDYLQLMESSRKAESRQQEITQISRELKGLAREFNCPLIALSQLNRAAEGRADHRPMMSDLRESGSLEQDADIVSFLYREEYYTKLPEHLGLAELIVAKQRNGGTGTVSLGFLKEITRFTNMFELP